MTDTTNTVPIVKIDCPLGVKSPAMYCPRTGNLVMAPNEDVAQPSSPFVTFIYLHEADQFEYLRADMQSRLEAARQALTEDDWMSDIELLMERTDLGRVPLIYDVTTKYMACGPVRSTVTVGFDLWTEDDEEEDDEEDEE